MQTKNTILVVDDDDGHRIMLKTLLSDWGYDIFEADDGSTAILMVEQRSYDMILMDVRMMRVSGIEALKKIYAYNPAIPIVIMTAYSSVEKAVEALKMGAHDYLTKPLDFERLKITIERSMEHSRLKEENRRLKQTLGSSFDTRNIIGHSPAMLSLMEMVAQAAPSDATVLLIGESGTGKELVAGIIHHNSSRNKGAFIKINCAAITESLLESELFGHEKGAFTGADRRKDGCFMLADGGTLLLDEVSEMPLTMQAKLLRVLQEQEVLRVGGEKVIPIDVRVVAATNKDLSQLVAAGEFREDLYYRLNVVQLNIPPLRQRSEDIPLLGMHFLTMFAEKNDKDIKGFTPAVMDRMINYNWPGNVRELMNAVERGVVLGRSDYLDDSDLSLNGSVLPQPASFAPAATDAQGSVSLEEVEKNTILKTLELTGGNKSEAARQLGITRKTLHKKLKKYGVMP